VERILDVRLVCDPLYLLDLRKKFLFDCMIANLPDESLPSMSSVTQTGVYCGYAQIYCPEHEQTFLCENDGKVLPMVMSLGWNPFYKNERMTAVRPALARHTPAADHPKYDRRKFTFCTSLKETFTDTK